MENAAVVDNVEEQHVMADNLVVVALAIANEIEKDGMDAYYYVT
jgi:hypothetical protein